MSTSSAKTFTLYKTSNGGPSSYWRNRSGPLSNVPGWVESRHGDYYGPEFEFVVRAKSAKQAHFLVYNEVVPSSDSDVGVYWIRSVDSPEPPPLTADSRLYHATIARCGGAPTIALYATIEAAQKYMALIDETGCGGGCCRDHSFAVMTKAEAEKLDTCWATVVEDAPAGWSGATFDPELHDEIVRL